MKAFSETTILKEKYHFETMLSLKCTIQGNSGFLQNTSLINDSLQEAIKYSKRTTIYRGQEIANRITVTESMTQMSLI